MKPYLLFFILFYSIKGFSQVTKIYLTGDNKYSADTTNAVAYMLIEKLPDSGYFVRQFDMQDTIMMQGTFKDEMLTEGEGKFIYYTFQKPRIIIRYDYDTHTADTTAIKGVNFISNTGYLNKSLKNGEWIEYNSEGKVNFTSFYKEGKRNGLHQIFNNDNTHVSIEGNYTDDKMTGEWTTYNKDKKVIFIDYYSKNGRLESKLITKEYEHFRKVTNTDTVMGYSTADLNFLLRERLRKPDLKGYGKIGYYGRYDFHLSVDGKLSKPVIEHVKDLKLDKALLETILASPHWKSASVNNKAVDSTIVIGVSLYQKDDVLQIKAGPQRFTNAIW